MIELENKDAKIRVNKGLRTGRFQVKVLLNLKAELEIRQRLFSFYNATKITQSELVNICLLFVQIVDKKMEN